MRATQDAVAEVAQTAQDVDYRTSDVMDRDSRPNRYYRNAVERHWDPAEIDFEQDLETLRSHEFWDRTEPATGPDGAPITFNILRTVLAMFGAGETEVTEDLAPLAAVSEDIDDQLFLTTQLYEEAKHMDFFDRYWTEVINPVERAKGLPESDPTEDRWYPSGYLEVLGRNGEAMHRLLEEDTPETRARAYCHYHLTVEAIIAQAGYYLLSNGFGEASRDSPHLPGLVEGVTNIRGDEGRHVGYGLAKTRELVASGAVDPELVESTIGSLIRTFVSGDEADALDPVGIRDRLRVPTHFFGRDTGISVAGVSSHVVGKHLGRMDTMREVSGTIPDADDLTALETGTNRVTNYLLGDDAVRRPRRVLRSVAGI